MDDQVILNHSLVLINMSIHSTVFTNIAHKLHKHVYFVITQTQLFVRVKIIAHDLVETHFKIKIIKCIKFQNIIKICNHISLDNTFLFIYIV